jgi:hypothetical protein
VRCINLCNFVWLHCIMMKMMVIKCGITYIDMDSMVMINDHVW